MSGPITLGAVENAILAKLAEAQPDLGYKWKTLESYPDDWPAYLAARREMRGPAGWVTCAGWDRAWETDAGNIRLEGVIFGVTVCGQSKRNEKASRHGGESDGEIGSYQLIQDVVLILAGNDLGLDIDRLEPGAGRPVAAPEDYRKQGLAFFATPFTTNLELVRSQGDFAPFSTLHANWDIPPFGAGPAGVIDAADLPQDATSDATDNLQLEQE